MPKCDVAKCGKIAVHHVWGMGLGDPMWDVVKCSMSVCGKAHSGEVCSAASLQDLTNCTVKGCDAIPVHHVAGMGLGDALWDVIRALKRSVVNRVQLPLCRK